MGKKDYLINMEFWNFQESNKIKTLDFLQEGIRILGKCGRRSLCNREIRTPIFLIQP